MKSALVQIIVKIAATIIIIIAVFYFLIAPKLSTLVQSQLEVERLGIDLKKADEKLSALKSVDKNRTLLDQAKNEVFALLPDEPGASSFILNIESASSNVGIIVDSLSVAETKNKTTTKASTASEGTEKSGSATTPTKSTTSAEKSLAFSASFTSDYSKAQEFLKRLELLPRFNTVESITLNNYRPDDGTLTLRAEGKIYYGK